MNFRILAASVRPRGQIFALLAATALSAALLVSGAQAQQPARPAPAGRAGARAEGALRRPLPRPPRPRRTGRRRPRPAGAPAAAAQPPEQQVQLIYAPWTKFCLKGQEAGAKQVCFTGKDGRIESGQPVIAAVIIEPEGEPKKILRVTLPLGMQLVHGTRDHRRQQPAAAEPLRDLLPERLHVRLRSDPRADRQPEEGPEPRCSGDQFQRRAADAAAAARGRIRQGL